MCATIDEEIFYKNWFLIQVSRQNSKKTEFFTQTLQVGDNNQPFVRTLDGKKETPAISDQLAEEIFSHLHAIRITNISQINEIKLYKMILILLTRTQSRLEFSRPNLAVKIIPQTSRTIIEHWKHNNNQEKWCIYSDPVQICKRVRLSSSDFGKQIYSCDLLYIVDRIKFGRTRNKSFSFDN